MSQRGSRAGSPTASGKASRAASPPPGGIARTGSATPAAASSQPAATGDFPTAAEIAKHVPKEGISVNALIAVFKGRVDKATKIQEFIAQVRKVAKNDPNKKGLLVPKSQPLS
jgi:transcription initiation factor TFIIF subunit alpha